MGGLQPWPQNSIWLLGGRDMLKFTFRARVSLEGCVVQCAVWASKRGLARKKAEEVGGAICSAQKITSPSLLSKFAHHLLLLHKSGPDLELCSMSRLMGRGKAELATSCPNICI